MFITILWTCIMLNDHRNSLCYRYMIIRATSFPLVCIQGIFKLRWVTWDMHRYAHPQLCLKDQFLEGKLRSPRTFKNLWTVKFQQVRFQLELKVWVVGNTCLRTGTACVRVRMLGISVWVSLPASPLWRCTVPMRSSQCRNCLLFRHKTTAPR